MSQDSPFSLFSSGSHKKSGATPKKAQAPAPVPPEETPEGAKEALEVDVKAVIEKIKAMSADLDQQLQDVHEKAKLSKIDIKGYLQDPKNFTIEQWRSIQTNREDLEKRIWSMLKQDPKNMVQRAVIDKDEKVRKGKTLGSRRHWIPMN